MEQSGVKNWVVVGLVVVCAVVISLKLRREKLEEREIRKCIDFEIENSERRRIEICEELVSEFPTDSRIYYTIANLKFHVLKTEKGEIESLCRDVRNNCVVIREFMDQELEYFRKKTNWKFVRNVISYFRGNDLVYLKNQNRECLNFQAFCSEYRCRYMERSVDVVSCENSIENLSSVENDLKSERASLLEEIESNEINQVKNFEEKNVQLRKNYLKLTLTLKEIYRKIGGIAFFLHDYERSIDYFDRVFQICDSSINPDNEKILFDCFWEYFEVVPIFGKYLKYEEALRMLDLGIDKLQQFETKKLEFGNPELAKYLYVVLGDLFDRKAYFFYKMGQVKNHDKALTDGSIKYHSKVLKMNPDELDSLLSRSRGFLQTGKFENSIEDFTNYIKKRNMGNYANLIGNDWYVEICSKIVSDLYVVEKDTRTAIQELGLSIKQSYAEEFCRISRAALYISTKRFEKAEKDMSTVIYLGMMSEQTGYFAFRSGLYYLTKEYKKSLKDCEKVLQMNDLDPRCLEITFLSNCGLGNVESATAIYEKYLFVNPPIDTCISNRGSNICDEKALQSFFHGRFLSDLSLFNESVVLLTETSTTQPFCAPSYLEIGLIWYQMRRYEESIEFFSKSIENDHDCNYCYFRRGMSKKMLRNVVEAIKDFEKAIEIDSESPEPYSSIFELYEITNNFAGIVEMCDRMPEDMLVNYDRACKLAEQLETYRS